jgi:hypothetical protein
MALTASSTFAAEMNCLQMKTKYIATVVSSEGRNDKLELCERHHLENLLNAYLYFFRVFSALAFRQYSGRSAESSVSSGSV